MCLFTARFINLKELYKPAMFNERYARIKQSSIKGYLLQSREIFITSSLSSSLTEAGCSLSI